MNTDSRVRFAIEVSDKNVRKARSRVPRSACRGLVITGPTQRSARVWVAPLGEARLATRFSGGTESGEHVAFFLP